MLRPSHSLRKQRPARRGLYVLQLLIALPLLAIVLMAIIEFALLASARNQLQLAAQNACREATMTVFDTQAHDEAIRAAAARALARKSLVHAHEIEVLPGIHSGDEVQVIIRVPMRAAAPNLLPFIYNLRDRDMVAVAVMRKE